MGVLVAIFLLVFIGWMLVHRRARYHVGRSALYGAAHAYYFTRALSRGPGYFAGYEVRRAARQAVWKLTRGWG